MELLLLNVAVPRLLTISGGPLGASSHREHAWRRWIRQNAIAFLQEVLSISHLRCLRRQDQRWSENLWMSVARERRLVPPAFVSRLYESTNMVH